MVLGTRTATLSQDDSLKGGGAPLTIKRGLLPLRQSLRIGQPYIACAVQQALSLLLGPPHLIDAVIDNLRARSLEVDSAALDGAVRAPGLTGGPVGGR